MASRYHTEFRERKTGGGGRGAPTGVRGDGGRKSPEKTVGYPDVGRHGGPKYKAVGKVVKVYAAKAGVC